MVIGIVAAVIGLLCVALVILVVVVPGPSAGEVALAYEEAWDHLDFEAIWALSGDELRDGLDRPAFIAAKRKAYEQHQGLRGLAADVAVDAVSEGQGFAVVHTRVELRDGGEATDALQLARRGSRWLVIAYELEPDAAGA
ncbi:MAG TPA: hypothetical protein VG012_01140 [Acidimicrobiia bacterium]|jgi:hypothetical protein|nr:hypothetical protein [Acidimicrobiia bacterium]